VFLTISAIIYIFLLATGGTHDWSLQNH